MSEPLLQVEELCIALAGEDGERRPVEGVSFELHEGQTLGLVGESGCGKSLTALSILGLLPSPAARVVGGRILFRGRDLLEMDERALRTVRGRRIAMVFQEPMTSLNPVYSCGEQVAEALRLHRGESRSEAWRHAVTLLGQVRIPDPERSARAFPHQLSGGMRQRVMIAMAISCGPELLIADEPTTALDVTIQREILELLDTLKAELGMSVLHITHDLGVIAERAHRILVMYAGQVVEEAPVAPLFDAPAHPYTLGLLACRPELGERRDRLPAIGGQVPEPGRHPAGCRFRPRCPFAVERCQQAPALLVSGPDRRSRCWEFERVRAEGRWTADA